MSAERQDGGEIGQTLRHGNGSCSGAQQPWTALLARTPLSQLVVPGQEIVYLEHQWDVARALQELARHRILSAPVVVAPSLEDLGDSPDQSSYDPQLLGWLDVQSILAAFLQHVQRSAPELSQLRMLQLMGLLEREGKAFAQTTLVAIAGAQDRGLVFEADAGTTVLEAVRGSFLGNGSQRPVHRLALFDGHGTITHIISQLDVLRFLLENVSELGGAPGMTLQQLQLVNGKGQVFMVDPHVPTLVAFQQMLQAGVSGAGVKGKDGSIMANLSISDLRCIQPDHLGTLALPVAEFLALAHGTSYAGYTAQGSASAVHPFFAGRSQRMSPPSAQQPERQVSMSQQQQPSGEQQPQQAKRHHPAQELPRINSGSASEEVRLVACSRGTTLEQLLRLFVDERVHRVYVHAEEGKAAAVVTPTDVMRMLVQQPP